MLISSFLEFEMGHKVIIGSTGAFSPNLCISNGHIYVHPYWSDSEPEYFIQFNKFLLIAQNSKSYVSYMNPIK